MPQYREGTYDRSIGAPPVPVSDERRINDLFWGEIPVLGGEDNDVRRWLQVPFMWDPRVNDWVSLTMFVYHFGINFSNTPIGTRDFFQRPGMGDDVSHLAVVPGDGYLYALQSSYNSGTITGNFDIQIIRTNALAATSDIVAEVPFPVASINPIPHSMHKFDPPIRFAREDAWTFELRDVGGSGEHANWPWIDVYWHFRFPDKVVDNAVKGAV